MAKYSYTAVDAQGKQANGTIEAADQSEAISQIRQLGFYPQRLDEKREDAATTAADKPVKVKRGGKVKLKILTTFTRQLATLIDAGLPLLRSLTTLARQERNPVMRNTMTQVSQAVESGNTFSEALAQHPGIFEQALRQHGQGRRTWAACSKSFWRVWPSSRKRRSGSRARSSPPWSIHARRA